MNCFSHEIIPKFTEKILATELHRFSQKEIFNFNVILPFGPELTAEGCFLWP
jgi:hypothetical protein